MFDFSSCFRCFLPQLSQQNRGLLHSLRENFLVIEIMRKFKLKTFGMMYRAMDKPHDEPFGRVEIDELGEHYEGILASTAWVACKELEAYMAINSCKNYDQLAKLIMKRERKNCGPIEYKKLLGRLRTRAHRGREKVIKKLSEIYET